MIDFDKIQVDLEKISGDITKRKLLEYQIKGPRYSIYQTDLMGNKIGNAVDHLYDLCGCSVILFKDKRSSFFKQYKKYLQEKENSKWFDVNMFRYPSSGRQEAELNEEVARACCEYLNKNFNAGCFVRSYLD